MRNLIFGSIGVLWGAVIFVGMFLSGGPRGQGAYRGGQIIGLLFACC